MAWPHAYAAQKPAVNPDAQVLQDFKARVDKYVELRKKADDNGAADEENRRSRGASNGPAGAG